MSKDEEYRLPPESERIPIPDPFESGNGYGTPYKKPDGAKAAAVFVAIIFFTVVIMLVIKLGLVLFT